MIRSPNVDLWDPRWHWRVVLTNTSVTSTGRAVMGRGTALQAATRYKHLPDLLGYLLRAHNPEDIFVFASERIITFPTKRDWKDPAQIDLIRTCTNKLAQFANRHSSELIALPPPGIGNGHLLLSDVLPIITSLPDNVHLLK